jgi:hypothetical protein
MYSEEDTQGLLEWVSPFGNLRVKGHLHLTEAYRCLSRPSSPADAKASPVCPCLLPITPSVFQKDQSEQSPLRLPIPTSGADINQPCSVSIQNCKNFFIQDGCLATPSFDKAVLLKMLVSHKEYGSIEKDLIPREGDIVVTLFLP